MSFFILSRVSNLSNILSTESISPSALYRKRTSGFRIFDEVDDSDADTICLYKNLPSLATSDDEGALMAIEISDKLAPNITKCSKEKCWTSETIYLSGPKDVKIHFLDEDTMNVAFNRTRLSIEAKFAEKYKMRVKTGNKGKALPARTLVEPFLPENDPFKFPARSLDSRLHEFEIVDRLKGALFCFGLGEQLAVPDRKRADYVQYMQTVDAYVNSVTQENETAQDEKLCLMAEILYKFALANEQKNKLERDEFGNFLLSQNLNRINDICLIEPPVQVSKDSAALEEFRSSLESRIGDAAGKKGRSQKRPEILGAEGRPLISLPGDDALADYLINELINTNYYLSAQKDIRYSFAVECGKTIRAFFADNWEGSPERTYINRLLTHLNEYDDFDINDKSGIENVKNYETLKALAMFCEKDSNKELGDFYRFLLIKCGITDFRLPFAIWGSIFGYSAIPKTLIDAIDKSTEDSIRKNVKKALQIVYANRELKVE